MSSSHTTQISKFWQLQKAGRSVALDINTKTGELAARYSVSLPDGVEGNGTPPTLMGDEWRRVMSCTRGVVNSAGVFVAPAL